MRSVLRECCNRATPIFFWLNACAFVLEHFTCKTRPFHCMRIRNARRQLRSSGMMAANYILVLLLLSYLSPKLVAVVDDPDCAPAKIAVKDQDVSLPLPLASARPHSADPGIDCSIKELAWEYSKKLLPQVRYLIYMM